MTKYQPSNTWFQDISIYVIDNLTLYLRGNIVQGVGGELSNLFNYLSLKLI